MKPIWVLATALLLAAGCPGSFPGVKKSYTDGGTSPISTTTPTTYSDGGSSPLAPDQKVTAKPDQSPAVKPDTTPPLKPDQGPPPPGGACSATKACPGGQVCFNSICYAGCQPAGGCKADSTCAPTQTCVGISNQPGVFICVAAKAQAGQACSASAWCPNSYVCVSLNGAAAKCMPQCGNPNGACGTGGTCFSGGSCNVCSAL